MKPEWHPNLDTLLRPLPIPAQHQLRPWLTKADSMTHHLETMTQESVKVLLEKQNWDFPAPSEADALALPGQQQVFIREVRLMCQQLVYMYARSLFPLNMWHQKISAVLNLGTYPLGKLLFQDPHLIRQPFLYAQLSSAHPLYQTALPHIPIPNRPHYLWARRSVFYWFKQPIILTEVFMPDLFHLKGVQ